MADQEKINILVVDDSPSKLLAMSAALAELNQNVVTARSGREALRHVLNQEFAVILLDVNMPDMDGFETAALIRERKSSAHVPIIFVTAYGDDPHAAQGYSLGAVDFLLTPVVPEVLCAKVSVFVELFRKNLQIKAQAEERVALVQEQAARRTAETANRMKDEFLGTLSHELRTPLNSILGWVHLLKTINPTPEDLMNGLAVIERNARFQAKIIEDLLDVSRIISGKLDLELRSANLVDIIEAAITDVQLNAAAKDITIERVFDAVPPLCADATRLQQVVWNLLSNAVKFTSPGGRITVSARCRQREVEVRVCDTGDGIDPEFLPYVFERFRQADASTTRRHGGLGIGLAIVRQLVEMHGGRVSVESAGKGHGASFMVNLPIPNELATSTEISAPAGLQAVADERGNSLEKLRILVVDDQQDARELVERILFEAGAEVVASGSVAEAFKHLVQFRPRIVVSDIGMPDQDGYDLIRQLRIRYSAQALPALALTAYARPEERARVLAAGFQAHLAKPVDPRQLVATVSALAGGAELRADAVECFGLMSQ